MITIVSGLPRSGTSLMMQMLQLGGMLLLEDGKRRPDASNLRGYLEYDRVKQIGVESSFLDEADGKALKIVVPLIRFVPENYRCKVLFMIRPISEIMRSQTIMLTRKRIPVPEDEDRELRRIFEQELRRTRRWLSEQPKMQVLEVSYRALIENSERLARLISNFLEQDLDISSMSKAVDPALHHEKEDAAEISS